MHADRLKPGENSILLVAIDLPAVAAVTAAGVAERMNLSFNVGCVANDELDATLRDQSCVVLIEASDWGDADLADLAARLALSGQQHGGIIASGCPEGVVSRHLATAGLLRAVDCPLTAHELMAALVAGLDKFRWTTRYRAPADNRSWGPFERSPEGSQEHVYLRHLLQGVIARRDARRGVFPDGLFSDPAWDILLSLAQARIEGRTTQASNIGLEAGIPPSTALRRVKDLELSGLVDRWGDPNDRRRDFVQLSDDGLDAFVQYAERVAATNG